MAVGVTFSGKKAKAISALRLLRVMASLHDLVGLFLYFEIS